MTRLDPAALARLDVMGISVWERRQADADVAAAAADSATGRIRLSSGEGDCLLVQRQPWGGETNSIVDDIRACIGPARCRFGQWAVASPAGEDPAELAERGISHVLSFGPALDGQWPGLIEAPSLVELTTDWQAKRALWRKIRPLLGER